MRPAWCVLLLAAIPACRSETNPTQPTPSADVAAATPPRYTIVKFPASLGGTNSVGIGINERGWIAGFSNLANGTRHAALWNDHGIIDLGTLGGPHSNVQWPGVNDAGMIAGIAETNEPDSLNEDWSCSAFFPTVTHKVCRGFFWQNSVMTALPTFGGTNGFATGVNTRGQVVGWAETTTFDPTCNAPQKLQFIAALWEPRQNAMRRLAPLPGDSTSAATAINERGQAVGISGDCDVAVGEFSARHSVLWGPDGQPERIGDLGGIAWNTPMSINERGDVVGFSNPASVTDGTFLPHAFLWTRSGGVVDLGLMQGHDFSQAFAINTRGEIVGRSCGPAGCRAVVWIDGAPVDINTLVRPSADVLLSARDINEAGRITGNVRDAATGKTVVFLAVPNFR